MPCKVLQGSAPSIDLTSVDLLSSAFQTLQTADIQSFDIILLDLSPASTNLNQVLQDLSRKAPDVPIIVLAEMDDQNFALEALKEGAQDYLDKQTLDHNALTRAIGYAIERKRLITQAAERAQETATNLDLALTASQTGVWSWDLITDKVSWDDRVLKVFGVSAAEFPGTFAFFMERVHPDDAGTVDSVVKACLQGKEECYIDYRVVWPDGSIHFVSVMGRTFFDAAGKPVRLAGVLRDVTKAKEEEQSAKRLALIEQREEFAAMLAHDLRTPVIGSQRILSLMIDGNLGEISDAQIDLLSRICNSNQSMLLMINNVLDCYKLESGTETLDCTEMNVRSLLSNCVTEMMPLAEIAKVKLEWAAAPSVGNIRADHLAMQRVMCNLVGNAIRFTPEGGSIELIAFERNGEAVLQIKDTGIGIAPEDLENLFERFWQARPNQYGPKGLGLGLYLCRQLIEAQRGTISCKSTLREGSIFEITMPLADDRASQAPIVLIVDDTVASQQLMKTCLGALSIDADAVASGREALDAVKNKEYAAVFMDLVMPDMDGFLTTKAMRKAGVTIPILAFTGHSAINDRDRFANAGFSDFVEKPVDRAHLKNVLERWIAV